ncbi:MAG: ATP-binding protein [Acidobacteriota bacterium]
MGNKEVIQQDYSCCACKDTGWVILSEDGIRRSARCPECGLKKFRARLLAAADIPAIYSDRDFSMFAAGDPSQAAAVARVVEFLEKYPDVERGLLLVGPCGVGKTHLSVALLKSLIMEKQVSGRFVDEAELLSRLQHSYNPDTQETEERILESLKNAELLVWDDLGAGRPTEWAKSKVTEVINYRYTHCKRTVMSSNYPMPGTGGKWKKLKTSETLEERVGTRLFSRIMEMCEVVEIDGADYRIEIHKAGMDFKVSNNVRKQSSLIPETALSCPKCSSREITIQDEVKSNEKGKGSCIDISGSCGSCGSLFGARFYLKTGKVAFHETKLT